jgi:hypothetical protein
MKREYSRKKRQEQMWSKADFFLSHGLPGSALQDPLIRFLAGVMAKIACQTVEMRT